MKPAALVLCALLAACACGRDAIQPDAPPSPTDVPLPDETEATKRALIDALVADGHPADKIHVDVSPGALATTRIHTRVDDAYPGDGLRTAIIAGGRRYGLGARDLADLARDLAWHATPPPPGDAAALVTFGWLPAMAHDAEVAPALERRPDALVLTFGAREAMSGDRSRVEAAMPRTGPARITITSAEAPPPEPPADAIAALEQALAGEDAMPIQQAVRRAGQAPPSPARSRALARAATLSHEAIAFDALLYLGATDEAATALGEAVKSLDDPQARARVIERARQAHGEAFARRITP